MADRILTTHAGSLPRPTDLIELIWAKMDGQEVDRAQLEDRMRSAVAEVVADRLVRVGRLIGRDRLLAGTDCGFDTFINFSQVDPAVAWHKLASMVQGAELATAELS
jgi:methionine synthase II (cobalamin-independent)